MLNIGRLGPDGADYYLSQVMSGVEDYYTGSGEAPGYWLGSEGEALGLVGLVDADDLATVLDGCDPASGESLGAQRGRKVPGFDLTFRAPKSVSILWGLGRREVSDEVRRAHDQAVLAALGYVEAHAAGSRRGRGGTDRINVSGVVAAAFRHRSSRAGDPLLHTHVVSVSAETLHTAWWDRARTRGVTSKAVDHVTGRVQYREPTDHEHRRSTYRLLGPLGLTEHDSTFSRRDVVRAWCEQMPTGAPAKQIATLTDQFLERDDVVRLVAREHAH